MDEKSKHIAMLEDIFFDDSVGPGNIANSRIVSLVMVEDDDILHDGILEEPKEKESYVEQANELRVIIVDTD